MGQSVVVASGGELDRPGQVEVVVREYGARDEADGRSLWVELTEHHRRLFGDDSIGGADPGGGFDAYLARSDRVGTWVAEVAGVVVGLTGLLDHGASAEVEPVVVATRLRGRGVGAALVGHVVAEAARRGYSYLAIRPVVRSVAAVQAFHEMGFDTLGGHVDLTMDLVERRHQWREGPTLHGRPFKY